MLANTEGMADESVEMLLRSIRAEEDTDAFEKLCHRYEHLLNAMVRQFAPSFGITAEGATSELSGIGMDELRQDAAMALYRAALRYDPDTKGQAVSFGLYAKICIRNAMISEIRRYRRQTERRKKQRLTVVEKGRIPIDIPPETMRRIETILSPYEKRVLTEYVQGKPPREIARVVGKTEKSVSNAIYRIKQKLRQSMGR